MRYLPKSPAERLAMLAEIGVASIDDLFAIIPAEYRLTRDLDVPRQQAESEIIDYFKAAAAKNATGYASFLGAGAYRHYRPADVFYGRRVSEFQNTARIRIHFDFRVGQNEAWKFERDLFVRFERDRPLKYIRTARC